MDEVIEYLLNFALKHGFSFVLTDKLKSSTPSCADPSHNKIIINTNWQNKNELPFQIAHEIGHMINNDKGILYYTSFASHSKIEHSANVKAIELLFNYSVSVDEVASNYNDFMEYYGIPATLESDVRQRYAEYYG